MKYIINSGVYEVDLKGTTNASFKGPHPSVIIATIGEPEVYYIVPLTTYTKERWNKLRKKHCYKIESTHSIARVDKMQIREKADIPQRYFEKYRLIIPTYEEMMGLHNKIKEHLSLSLDKAASFYKKYYEEYQMLNNDWSKFLSSKSCENTNFVVSSEDPLELFYPLSEISNLSFDDMKNVFISGIYDIKVAYNKSTDKLIVKLSNKA